MTFIHGDKEYESRDVMLREFLASCLTPLCDKGCTTKDGLCELDERYLADTLKRLKNLLGGEWE